MIIYLLLKAILFILGIISSIFGELIPSFPEEVVSVLDVIATMVEGGVSFIAYFFYIPVLVGLISLVISWHGFKVVKDALMKVIGHFVGN